MMTTALVLIGAVILGAAFAAMVIRNLIHSALLLIASWAGVAAFYLWAGAEFVAFAQILVYVGAISMVVLFAVLLTRQSPHAEMPIEPAAILRAMAAAFIVGGVGALISAALLATKLPALSPEAPSATVKQIGLELMGTHGAALLILGVLLTVALLGATVIAATDKPQPPEDAPR